MPAKMVLYAEDDFANRRLMEIQLAKNGITCDIVENGRRALEAFAKSDYKVVILDQNMPEKTGAEVAREIRKTNPTIPIIALTSDDSAPETYQSVGFTHILIKPLLDNTLMDLVRAYSK